VRYSLMPLRVRQLALSNIDNYPFRTKFLGKTGLLGFEAIDLLIRNGVDFEIDDAQVAEILSRREEEPSPPAVPATSEKSPREDKRKTGIVLLGVSSIPVLYDVLKAVRRYVSNRSRSQ
jgi:hypothetical protein